MERAFENRGLHDNEEVWTKAAGADLSSECEPSCVTRLSNMLSDPEPKQPNHYRRCSRWTAFCQNHREKLEWQGHYFISNNEHGKSFLGENESSGKGPNTRCHRSQHLSTKLLTVINCWTQVTVPPCTTAVLFDRQLATLWRWPCEPNCQNGEGPRSKAGIAVFGWLQLNHSPQFFTQFSDHERRKLVHEGTIV